jgi:hypothetical protein
MWKLISLVLALLPAQQATVVAMDMVLQKKDVQFFKVEQQQNPLKLTISGLAFHSALAVDGFSTVVKADVLRVDAKLVLARPGLSGSFSITVDVPPAINKVAFGSDADIIWTR